VKRVVLAGMMALAMGPAAEAEVLLDQSNLDMTVGLNGALHWQQQITSGLAGQLAGISLWGVGSARVSVAEGDAYSSGPFAYSEVVAFETPGKTYIDLSAANIFLSLGEAFVIDLTEGTNGYGAARATYAGGDLWLDTADGPTDYTVAVGGSGITLRFETYVAVPEPSTWALMIAGFGLAGSGLRRRTAAAAA